MRCLIGAVPGVIGIGVSEGGVGVKVGQLKSAGVSRLFDDFFRQSDGVEEVVEVCKRLCAAGVTPRCFASLRSLPFFAFCFI